MKNTKKLILIFALILIAICVSCTETVEPEIPNLPYVSLTIGDERQFFFTTDSSTVLYVVKEKLVRSDGFDVYTYEWYYGKDTIPSLSHYAIKDGFFIATELDTVRDSLYYLPGNPFREQRLAKLYPKDGDIWQSIPGDSTSLYFVAKNIGTQITPAGVFNNSFSFTLDNFLSVNYSKGIGHISSILLSDSSGVLSNYLKVKQKIYGTKIPAKDPVYPNAYFKKNRIRLFNYLLGAN